MRHVALYHVALHSLGVGRVQAAIEGFFILLYLFLYSHIYGDLTIEFDAIEIAEHYITIDRPHPMIALLFRFTTHTGRQTLHIALHNGECGEICIPSIQTARFFA